MKALSKINFLKIYNEGKIRYSNNMYPILVVIIAVLVTIAILVIAGYICKAIGKKYKREALVIYDEIKNIEKLRTNELISIVRNSKIEDKLKDVVETLNSEEYLNSYSKRNTLEFMIRIVAKYADSYNDIETREKAYSLSSKDEEIYAKYNKKASVYNALNRFSFFSMFISKDNLQIL